MQTAAAALEFARSVHEPDFIAHPEEVAALLRDAAAPEHLVAAGALHDTIEKAGVTPAELRERFGERVASLVCAVSEDPRIEDYCDRKDALRAQAAAAGRDAQLLFAADKVSKVRELRRKPASEDLDRERRIEHYRGSLAMLEERLPDAALTRQLRRELAAYPVPVRR
jgi:(p)ppGpp synthase/HD superfamily hydrolase